MKFLNKIMLCTFLLPFALSEATDKSDDRDVKDLRIIVTPQMMDKFTSIEDQIHVLLKEAEELGIKGSDKMNFNVLSMAVHKAKLEKEPK